MVVPPAPPPAPKRSPLKWILLGCGGLTLIGSLLFGGCVYFIYKATAAPADATHAFFNEVGAGDLSGAYAATSSEFQATVPRAKFDGYFSNLKFSDVTINHRNVTNQTATMSGTVTVSGGSTYAVTVTLLQVGGTWKVQFIQGPLGDFLESRVAR